MPATLLGVALCISEGLVSSATVRLPLDDVVRRRALHATRCILRTSDRPELIVRYVVLMLPATELCFMVAIDTRHVRLAETCAVRFLTSVARLVDTCVWYTYLTLTRTQRLWFMADRVCRARSFVPRMLPQLGPDGQLLTLHDWDSSDEEEPGSSVDRGE